MERRESELGRLIQRRLMQSNLRFDREPAIGGLRPDFLVWGPGEIQVVVEAKGWSSGGGNTARARDQVKFIAEKTGVGHALIVLWETQRQHWKWGVVGIEGLVPALNRIFDTAGGERPAEVVRTPTTRTVFAAMPFERRYDDTFFVAISHAAEQLNAVAERVDLEEFSGDIVVEIRQRIIRSTAVVIDLSESKPNVLYEAGLAHALHKPVVHISSTSLGELPFDVRNWNTLKYSTGQTAALRDPLTRHLAAAIGP